MSTEDRGYAFLIRLELIFSLSSRNTQFLQILNDQSIKHLITRLIVLNIAPLTVLFCNCPLFKDINFNTKCLLVWFD